MKITLFLLLLFSNITIAQRKITIIDSLSGIPLSYANIKYANNGVYSDANGNFIINNEQKISISYLGYKSKSILNNELKDTIFLKPLIEKLNEIQINTSKKIKIKFQKKPKGHKSTIISTKTEVLMVILPNENIINYYMDKVAFSFAKLTWQKNKDTLKKEFAIVRVNIYNLINENPNNLIFTSNPIKINALNRGRIVIDLKSEYLMLEKEGLAFGIEYIGNIDQQGNFYNNKKLLLRPILIKNNHKYYRAKTFLKYPLKNKKILEPLNDFINLHLPKGYNKTFNRNLAISFELSK